MKLVLVRPNIPSRNPIPPPLGLMYISAAAKKAGHDVMIHDSWLKNERAIEPADFISNFPIDVVGIQVHFNTVEWTKKFIHFLRDYVDGKKTKIIIGGPYVTAVGSKARNETGADVAIIGEFDNLRESTFDNIIKLADMQGYKAGTYKTEPTDINKIPIPDYDSINLPDYWPHLQCVTQPTKGKRIGVIQRTRGCRENCTFCSAGFTLGKKVRIRDDENVIEEIKYLQERWDVNEIWFNDDDVIADKRRGHELFEKMADNFPGLHVRFPLGIRIENIDINMVYAMKQAGVYSTGIGIESGNIRVLKRIKKRIDLAEMKRAIALLNGFEIATVGFFIFGLPTETREEMEDTIKYAMSTKLKFAQFGIFIGYPGAEDYNEKSLPSQHELMKIQRNATLRFYLRPRILWGMIKHLRLSQLKALWEHRWIKNWLGRK